MARSRADLIQREINKEDETSLYHIDFCMRDTTCQIETYSLHGFGRELVESCHKIVNSACGNVCQIGVIEEVALILRLGTSIGQF